MEEAALGTVGGARPFARVQFTYAGLQPRQLIVGIDPDHRRAVRPRTGTPAAVVQADNVVWVIPRSPPISLIVAPSVTR